jgi:hypothetical protein
MSIPFYKFFIIKQTVQKPLFITQQMAIYYDVFTVPGACFKAPLKSKDEQAAEVLNDILAVAETG